MCPAGLTTMVWAAAGTGSTGGIAAFALKKIYFKNGKTKEKTYDKGITEHRTA